MSDCKRRQKMLNSKIELLNKIVNEKEYAENKTVLSSLPQFVVIAAHYHCNAKCRFCTQDKSKIFNFKSYKKLLEPQLQEVYSAASQIGFHGFGEFLRMPEIDEVLKHYNKTIPEKKKDIFTNGTFSEKQVIHSLIRSNYQISVSLHSTDYRMHKYLTGMDSYELILENIKKLVKAKKHNPSLNIHLVFVANSMLYEKFSHFRLYTGVLLLQ